jgi:hypothetical protein
MNALDRTAADVGDKRTITESIVQLLHNIASEVRGAAGNEEASRAHADMLDSNGPHLAAVVMANTPMILATPPVHPTPGAAGGGPDKLDVMSITGTPDQVAEWASEDGDLREVEREEHPNGTVTVYFRPVPAPEPQREPQTEDIA